MALFSSEFNSLDELLVEQLEDLYDAEKRLTEALPKMADAANSSELKQAFQSHLPFAALYVVLHELWTVQLKLFYINNLF